MYSPHVSHLIITPGRCTFLTALQIWFRPPWARPVVYAHAAATSPYLNGNGRDHLRTKLITPQNDIFIICIYIYIYMYTLIIPCM